MADAALVYAALYNAALRKSGLVSNGCSGREIFLVYIRYTLLYTTTTLIFM